MSTAMPPGSSSSPDHAKSTPALPAAPAAGVPSSGSSAPTPASDAVGRSGCGCLRGCLIFLIVLVAGAGLLALAGATLGRAYVARNLPQWEAENPWLTLALDTTGLRDQVSTTPGKRQVDRFGRQAGQDDKSLMPEDIPVQSKPLNEIYSIGADQVTAYQELSESPDDAAGWLRQSMQEKGWEAVAERQTGDSLRLTWRKQGQTCQAEILSPRGVTELWLRCGGQSGQ